MSASGRWICKVKNILTGKTVKWLNQNHIKNTDIAWKEAKKPLWGCQGDAGEMREKKEKVMG